MRANVQTFTKIFRKRSDVSARRTRYARVKVEGAVEVVLDQLALRSDSFELINRNLYRFTLNALTASREFVQFLTLDLFGRVHRRHLVYLTAKSLERCFNSFLRPFARQRHWPMNRSARPIARVSSVSESNDSFIFFINLLQKLREARSLANQNHEHASRKWIESSRVTDATF